MIRLALIGCGDAQAAYVRTRTQIRNAEFVAVVDRDSARCREAADALDTSIIATLIEDLFGEQ